MLTREIAISNVTIGGDKELSLIAGPCVIESEESIMAIAKKLKTFSLDYELPLIFKSSYDKANRTSLTSFRGPGLAKGLALLKKVKEETGLPVISDVHSVEEVGEAAKVLDILQIPAFLCRQTDLVVAAADTGLPVNVKKGQFLAPFDVKNIIDKITSRGNNRIVITERGVTFGYNNLVVDMRAIPIIQEFGFPVVFDATHSVQLPGGQGTCSGGQRQYIGTLARAAVAAGCNALFMEVHENPQDALCDSSTMFSLDDLPSFIKIVKKINALIRQSEAGEEKDKL
jgi:2-dehydro-3-deoxyphosphooctonate aldolase (KDO 8-P synthase)